MKHGVFGGSFDPIHRGHVQLAAELMQLADLDCIRFLPAAQPPHKTGHQLAAGHHRLAMLNLSVAEHDGFLTDERELVRGGVSYTVETLRELRSEFPDDSLMFIIGSDSLKDLPQWFEIDEIARLAEFLVAARPGENLKTAVQAAAAIPHLRFELLPTTPMDVASSEIRKALRNGEPVEEWLDGEVLQYLQSHELYD